MDIPPSVTPSFLIDRFVRKRNIELTVFEEVHVCPYMLGQSARSLKWELNECPINSFLNGCSRQARAHVLILSDLRKFCLMCSH